MNVPRTARLILLCYVVALPFACAFLWPTLLPLPPNQALIAAVADRDLDATQAALDHGADPNFVLEKPPLVGTQCIRAIPAAFYRCIFRRDATPDEDETFSGFFIWHGALTPLGLTSYLGDEEIASLLLARGANANFAPVKGGPAFLVAAYQACNEPGRTGMVRFLLSHGATVCFDNGESHRLIHRASSSRYGTRLLRLLLNAGADSNQRDGDGYTPLMWAAMYSPDNVALLLRYGADVRAVAKNGPTAFDWASGNKEECLQLLKQASKHPCVVPAHRRGKDVKAAGNRQDEFTKSRNADFD